MYRLRVQIRNIENVLYFPDGKNTYTSRHIMQYTYERIVLSTCHPRPVRMNKNRNVKFDKPILFLPKMEKKCNNNNNNKKNNAFHNSA